MENPNFRIQKACFERTNVLKPLVLLLILLILFSLSIDCCKCNQDNFSEAQNLTVLLASFGDVFIPSGYSRLGITVGEQHDVILGFRTTFESKGREDSEIRVSVSFVCSGIEEFSLEPGEVEISWFRWGSRGWNWLSQDITAEAIPYSMGERFEKLDQSLNVCVYAFDIVEVVRQAQQEIWSTVKLECNASEIIVKGELSFSAKIWGCVRPTVGVERDITVRVRFLNVTDLRTTFRTPDQTTILHAKAEGNDMLRVLPNKVKYTFLADSTSSIYEDMYVEWRFIEIPEPYWYKPPLNWILSGIVGFMIGFVLNQTISVLRNKRKLERQKREEERRKAVLEEKKRRRLRSARRIKKKK